MQMDDTHLIQGEVPSAARHNHGTLEKLGNILDTSGLTYAAVR
jgi:hypothetical protein